MEPEADNKKLFELGGNWEESIGEARKEREKKIVVWSYLSLYEKYLLL